VRFLVLVVGKVRDRALAEAVAEYERRAARYWPLDVKEVREGSGGADDVDSMKAKEGERLLEAAEGFELIVCDERGESMTSSVFAAFLQRLREEARNVAFVIGGSGGLHDRVKARGSRLLALSPWTLPHEMARLVLVEQLYRAGTIVRREPYHK
jgi:23S rRNA (pseudouridine1915-N3)-methyltransferase